MRSINRNKNENNHQAIIEALLFVSEKPLLIEQIHSVLNDLQPTDIRDILQDLQSEYLKSNRGIRIIEVAGGFQLVTASE